MLRTLFLILIGGILFTSCRKAESLEPPSNDYILPGEQCNTQVFITGDTLTRAGSSLYLVAEAKYNKGPIKKYTWYLPNGDSSETQALKINEITPEHEGTYIVQATGQNNCFAQSYIEIRVLPAEASCNPIENSMEIHNESDIAFTNTLAFRHNVNQNLVVQASNADYSMEIQFRGDTAIEGKLYHITDDDNFAGLEFNEVLARYTYQSGTPFKSLRRGNAYISYDEDGILSVTLCNARFSDGLTTKDVDANITND